MRVCDISCDFVILPVFLCFQAFWDIVSILAGAAVLSPWLLSKCIKGLREK